MKTDHTPNSPVLWVPGTAPNAVALARMREHFAKPTYAMGEAWFMSEHRKVYDELLTLDIDTVPTSEFDVYIEEISGISAFGPREEWTDWFHYFLPNLLLAPRFDGPAIVETLPNLIAAFIIIYPEDIVQPYAGFRDDVLETLGVAIMHPCFWENGSVRDSRLFPPLPVATGRTWNWSEVNAMFASSCFFMWKYLAASQIEPWLRSVFAIHDGPWLAQLIMWLLAARPVLNGEIDQPSKFEKFSPPLAWKTNRLNGHYTGAAPIALSPFISEENKTAFHEALTTSLSTKLVGTWIDSIATFPSIETNLCRLPDRFLTEYADYLT